MVNEQIIFVKLKVSETLKVISITLQNLKLLQLRVDEIVGGVSLPPSPGIKLCMRRVKCP